MKISKSIFRAYDIRGTVGKELSETAVRMIALGLAVEMKKKDVRVCALGRDMRSSSHSFSEIIKKSLSESGLKVKDCGEVPTPVLYYCAKHEEGESGIMITGSHNPPEYNGLKIVLKGAPFWGNDLQVLYKKISTDCINLSVPDNNCGSIEIIKVDRDYAKKVIRQNVLRKPLRIAVDAGNGIAGPIATEIYEKMGCEVTRLFCTPDGNFPNHHPDPAEPKNMMNLIEVVKEKKLDLGLAFDGDGDRIGLVSSEGEIIWPDRQMMIFSEDVLTSKPGSSILFDVKCSRNLRKWVEEKGGYPIMWKTGHSYMKSKLRETNAVLAGEMSGHIFFNDQWYGFDDAVYAGARLLSILARKESIQRFLKSLPDSSCTPELKMNIEGISVKNIMSKLKSTQMFPRSIELNFIDGIRVEYQKGFGLVRPSNTTPSLVFRFEGDDLNSLEQIKYEFRVAMKQVLPHLETPF